MACIARLVFRAFEVLPLGADYKPEMVFNASTCGNNCAWWILRMAAKRDITINLRHLMVFGNGRFSIRVLNSGNVVHDMLGFIEEYDVTINGASR